MLSLSDYFAEPGLVAVVSGRQVDFSLSDSGPKLNSEQEQLIGEYVGDYLKDMVFLKQVHGRSVIELAKKYLANYSLLEADGLITRERNVPLSIRTADCLPVFLFDTRTKGIGLVHAGWKGTQQKILPTTVRQMQEKWGTKAEDIKAVLGPAIRECCYQVGEEFQEYFPAEVKRKPQGLYLDLPLANRNQIRESGVRSENIFDCGLCTCCNEQFFSYRREGERAGRMISLMLLKSA